MDYLHLGKTMLFLVNPPPVDEEQIPLFQDGLRDTVSEKIEELLLRMNELEEERKDKLEALRISKRRGETDEISEYLWILLTEVESCEYDIAQRWLKYWLDIVALIAPEQVSYHNEMRESNFSEYEIEQAKEYPLEDLYKGQLRARGTQLFGVCPFHEERTPSFIIFTNDNHFHCFGCGAHGDVITYLMETKHVTFMEAVKALR
jgi:hypothetical protein